MAFTMDRPDMGRPLGVGLAGDAPTRYRKCSSCKRRRMPCDDWVCLQYWFRSLCSRVVPTRRIIIARCAWFTSHPPITVEPGWYTSIATSSRSVTMDDTWPTAPASRAPRRSQPSSSSPSGNRSVLTDGHRSAIQGVCYTRHDPPCAPAGRFLAGRRLSDLGAVCPACLSQVPPIARR